MFEIGLSADQYIISKKKLFWLVVEFFLLIQLISVQGHPVRIL